MAASVRDQDILLKGGLIVDGSGGAPYSANLLIRGGAVARITPRPVRTKGVVIDCAQKVVAPGFIDAHSHLDWYVPIKGHDELKYPFLAQGITTAVAGGCGLSAAGFREGSAWKDQITEKLSGGLLVPLWDTVDEYFTHLEASGSSQNIALLAGHGSTRASLRGGDPSPLHPYETKELLYLLERAMDQGARGISVALQFEPGTHARPEELVEMARLARKKNRILDVHPRALAPAKKIQPTDAVSEAIAIARTTGVRLQISRLFFTGLRAGRNAEAVLEAVDAARKSGLDVGLDVTPFHCGTIVIGALFPPWFLARGAGAYGETASIRKLKHEIRAAERQTGIGPADIQVINAIDPELSEYNGRFLTDHARIRRMSPHDALIDISRRSAGQAKVLVHRSATDRVVEFLVRHPATLFMTDAWVERFGVQNPAAYGAFPRLLRLAREHKLLKLEDVVRKMTGATAERFGLAGRGTLTEGAPADITVFDWESVSEGVSSERTPAHAPAAASSTPAAPQGIDYVFVNGKKIIGSGKKENPLNAGVPLR
jgi:N-acyl-D-aspartate/D-glutamate deacylase